MTNTYALLIYLNLAIAISFMLLHTFANHKNQDITKYSILFYSSFLIWILLECMYFILPNPTAIRFFIDFKLGFVGFSNVFAFIVICSHFDLYKKIPYAFKAILIIFPIIIFIASIFTNYHDLLLYDFNLISTSPSTIVTYTRGSLFYIHVYFCQALLVCFAGIIIYNYKLLNLTYRFKPFLFAAIISIIIVSFTMFLEKHSFKNTIDQNIIFGFGFSIFLYFILQGYDKKIASRFEKYVFDYIDEAVIIVDENDTIVEMNESAKNLAINLLKTDLYGTNLNEIIEILSYQNRLNAYPQVTTGGEHIYFFIGGQPIIYNYSFITIPMTKFLENGRYLILNEITDKALYNKRLLEVSGTDEITGLPNMYKFRELVNDFYRTEQLPVSYIMCKVNVEKNNNMQNGFIKFDNLIKSISRSICQYNVKLGIVARISTETFLMIMPKCSENDCTSSAKGIKSQLENYKEILYTTISCRTKYTENDNTYLLINEMFMEIETEDSNG